MQKRLLVIFFLIVIGVGLCWADEGNSAQEVTLDSKYPRLSSGPLRRAVLATLPTGVVAEVEEITITTKDIAAEIAKKPKEVQSSLTKYPFYVLDTMLTDKLITKDASVWASINGVSLDSEEQLIREYLKSIAGEVTVSDEELLAYFKENQSMFGTLTFEQVKSNLHGYLVDQKRMKVTQDFINSVGERHRIRVSQRWAALQYAKWVNNPVEKARRTGKPALINFGSEKCAPCEMMKPILEKLTKDYEGKVSVVFVHVGKEPILSAQYGVRVIPCQLFCDRDGKEVFRHEGFYSMEAIQKKFSELGFE